MESETSGSVEESLSGVWELYPSLREGRCRWKEE